MTSMPCASLTRMDPALSRELQNHCKMVVGISLSLVTSGSGLTNRTALSTPQLLVNCRVSPAPCREHIISQ
jgi:hypothetical protein